MEQREPKVTVGPKGFSVTCTCGNHINIEISPIGPAPQQRPVWQMFLICLGAAAVGAGWSQTSRWLPHWLFLSVTGIVMAAVMTWFVRTNRALNRDIKANRQKISDLGRKINAPWQ